MGKRAADSDASSEEPPGKKSRFDVEVSADAGGFFSGFDETGGSSIVAAQPASAVPPGFSGILGMGADFGGMGGTGGGGQMPDLAGMQVPDLAGMDRQAANRLSLGADAKVETTPMDFSSLGKGSPASLVPVPKKLVQHVMTPDSRRIIEEQTGAEIEWAPDYEKGPQAMVRGSSEQVRFASKLIARVKTHCHWGCSEDKVRRLLKPRIIEKALCRLSPMDSLRPVDKLLSSAQPRLNIGKGKECDAVVSDSMVSRLHCFLELSAKKGAIYITDCSTNGTYLNGVRLPSRKLGKVLLSHGDELLLKEPSSGTAEFGSIGNITEIHVKAEVKFDAPRRLLSAEEVSIGGREFS
jgi:hypothetical protein